MASAQEDELRSKLGDLYDPTTLDEWARRDYDPNYEQRIVNKELLRNDNAPNSDYHENGQGGYLTGPQQTPQLGYGSGGVTGSGGGYSNAGNDAFGQQIRQQILSLMQSAQQPVDAAALANSPESRSYQRVAERQLQENRSRQAEQRAAEGVGQAQGGGVSGALGGDIATGQNQLAETLYAHQSQLVGREMQNRRDQLAQALSLGAGILSGDQSDALRRELAQLDAALQREQLGADIGYKSALLNQGAYGSLFG